MADDDRAGDHVDVAYTNDVGFGGTSSDAVIVFELKTPGPDGLVSSRPPLLVHMPWEEARALHEILGRGIAKYESDVGAIRDVTKGGERIEEITRGFSSGPDSPKSSPDDEGSDRPA